MFVLFTKSWIGNVAGRSVQSQSQSESPSLHHAVTFLWYTIRKVCFSSITYLLTASAMALSPLHLKSVYVEFMLIKI